MVEKLFTYGTLRNEQKATHQLSGYNLHLYSWFPFVKKGDGRVLGNIHITTERGMAALDHYEGVDNRLYKREKVEVEDLATGEKEQVWVYVPDTMLDGDYTNYPVINSGDWHEKDNKNER